MVNDAPERESEAEHRLALPQPLSRDEVGLTFALLGAPVSWALHLALSYGLVYPAARWQTKLPLYAVSLFCASPALLAGLTGLLALRRAAARHMADEARRERTRFVAICACAASGFFLLGMLAHDVPVFILSLEAR
jgi:hypothetical protein